ncbi:hypothetical protein ACFFWC_29925 [Plantactinospora siamensis]|uniref:Septum formation initiator n=1 Tax=Plantactinospora siamensis TaxID=555372 RepID=A0ABV6P0E6_9ACTN
MDRRVALVAGWLCAAAVATGGGLAAVRLIAAGIGSGPAARITSGEEVARDLATGGAASAWPSAGATATPGSGPTTATTAAGRVFSSPGGTVIARCDGGRVVVLTTSPAQGFGTRQDAEKADDHVRVEFTGPERIEMDLRCGPDGPAASWRRHG